MPFLGRRHDLDARIAVEIEIDKSDLRVEHSDGFQRFASIGHCLDLVAGAFQYRRQYVSDFAVVVDKQKPAQGIRAAVVQGF